MSSLVPAEPIVARRSIVLIACMIATFASAIESTIVATAMPSIVARLGDFSLFAWVFSVYMLGQAVSIPLFGRLADVYGRKRAFYIGTGIFLLGSTLCGLASSMPQLVLFRVLQGIGAGGVQPIANTIVGDLYSREERGRMQGLISSVYCISAVAGPSLGSFLVQYESWPAVFWINLPICLTASALIMRFLPEIVQDRPHRVDYLGSLLLMFAVVSVMLALHTLVQDLMPGHAIGNGVALGGTSIGVVALLLLIRHERNTPDPILPLDLWRSRVIAVGCLGGGIAGALMMGVAAFLPPYVQGVMGRNASIAGFVLGTMSVLWTVASVGAGTLLVHTSYRVAAVLGTLLLLVGALTLIVMTPDSGPVWAATGSGLIGVGMGLCTTTFIVSIQSAVDWHQRGAATSSMMFLRCMGQALGVALFGGVVNLTIALLDPDVSATVNQLMHVKQRQSLSTEQLARLTDVMATSIHYAFLLAGILALIAFGLAWCLPTKLSPKNQT